MEAILIRPCDKTVCSVQLPRPGSYAFRLAVNSLLQSTDHIAVKSTDDKLFIIKDVNAAFDPKSSATVSPLAHTPLFGPFLLLGRQANSDKQTNIPPTYTLDSVRAQIKFYSLCEAAVLREGMMSREGFIRKFAVRASADQLIAEVSLHNC